MKLGALDFTAIKVGALDVTKVMRGADQVWAASTPPSGPGEVAVSSDAYAPSAATTEHNVPLPAGIEAGDLLLVFFVTSNSWDPSMPTGWEIIDSQVSVTRSTLFAKVADGDEGSSVTVTITGTAWAAAISVLAKGADTAASPHLETEYGASDGVDPPSLSASWGDTRCWLAFVSSRQGRADFTAAPTGFAGLEVSYSSEGSSSNAHHSAGFAYRITTTTTTEDPGAFTASGSTVNPRAMTAAVRS